MMFLMKCGVQMLMKYSLIAVKILLKCSLIAAEMLLKIYLN
jgi:hypothetical protein